MRTIEACTHFGRLAVALGLDALRFIGATLRSRTALVAENLFLRKQLACVTKHRKVPAVQKMKEGPSEPSSRRRLQTAMSGCRQKLWS